MNWQVQSRDRNSGELFTIPRASSVWAIETMKWQQDLDPPRDVWIEDGAGRRQMPITIEVNAELVAYVEVAAAVQNKTVDEWIADQLKPPAEEAWGQYQEQKAANAKLRDKRDRRLDDLMKGHTKRPEES
jgi:hypothetical protein